MISSYNGCFNIPDGGFKRNFLKKWMDIPGSLQYVI